MTDPNAPLPSRAARARSFARRHRLALIVAGALLLIVVLPVAWLLRPTAPEYITAVVRQGDLRQTVEAVGTVTSERDLELKFPMSGIVERVWVKEGDRVAAGQALAQLKSAGLSAAVAIQAANLQSAVADLRKMEEGTRPEDIAIAEAQVANKRASLQVAQAGLRSAEDNLAQTRAQLKTLEQEALTTLAGQVETSRSTLGTQLVAGETALSIVDDIFGNVVVQDAIVKAQPGGDAEIRVMRNTAQTSLQNVRRDAVMMRDYHEALLLLRQGKSALTQSMTALDRLFGLLGNIPETSYFTAAIREQYRTSISAQRSALQTAMSSVTNAEADLQSASAGFDTRIAAAQASITTNEGLRQKAEVDILTFKTALQAQEADLALKKAGTRKTDLDAARARMRQAQASLARAQADLADTLLRAPVEGAISRVEVKVGEAAPTGPAVTMLGNSPFRVEMFISEVDVPKLAVTQSGSIELDAFPDIQYKMRLSEIDTAPTLVEGVSKYRVKLDFVYPHEEFKIGMTGDVTVVTGERRGVLTAPLRAVLTTDGDKMVRVLRGGKVTEKRVTVGMEGEDGDVEILTGVGSGETVVVLVK